MAKFISIRVIEAEDLYEAHTKVMDGDFIDDHDLSDVIIPLPPVTANSLLNQYNHAYDTNQRNAMPEVQGE